MAIFIPPYDYTIALGAEEPFDPRESANQNIIYKELVD